MKIDSELTEKSAKNTQRWWKLTATLDHVERLPGEPGQFHLWPGIGQGS